MTLDKEITPTTNISSSSPNEVVMLSPPSLADYFKQFQDLIKERADSFQILLEEDRESQHKLLDILQTSSSVCIMLPVNEALLDQAKIMWYILATIWPTCKREGKKYYIPSENSEFLFLDASPNSLVINAVNEHGR